MSVDHCDPPNLGHSNVPVASFEGKKVTEWSFFDIKRNDDVYVYFMSFKIKNQL